MVISDSFIWLHIPKTAGDATLLMFEELQHPWRLLDRHTDPRKHGTLVDAHTRVPESASFAVIANLRRLPEVALSYFHHMQRHCPDELFASGQRWGEFAFSDYIRWVIDHPQTQSYDWILDHHLGDRDADHWLRASSSLAESFIDVIGRHVEIPEEARARIHTLSANVGPYAKKSLDAWYAPEEVEALYANCPRWAATERRIYGGLAVIAGGGS